MGQAISRSEAREIAFRLLFAGGDWRTVLPLALGDRTASAPELSYIENVVTTAQNRQAEFDAEITQHLHGWTLDRLKQTDLAALRLGVAELALGAVPAAVAIKEATQIAKKYGDEHSAAFVNGVLAHFVG